MESKAKKAASAHVEDCIKVLIKRVSHGYIKDTWDNGEVHVVLDLESIEGHLEDIRTYINEYGLEDRVLLNAIETIYDILMKTKRFDDAASFAKKHGL